MPPKIFKYAAFTGGIFVGWKLFKSYEDNWPTWRWSELTKFGLPQTEQLIKRRHFVASVNYETRQPSWVLEHLTAEMLREERADRANVQFQADPSIPVAFRAENSDYFRSGYSRGHLCPAGNSKMSGDAMRDSFLLSANIVPQDLDNNMFYWNRLEKFAKSLTEKFANVFVLSGPLFLKRGIIEQSASEQSNDMVAYKTIGKNQVAVPTHLFKVLLVEPKSNGEDASPPLQLACFIIPNEPIADDIPVTQFQVSLNEFEQIAGMKIFPQLSLDQVRDLCAENGCDLMDGRLHRIQQWTRSLKSARTKWYLDKAMNELKKLGDDAITPELAQIYQDRLEEIARPKKD